MHLSPKPKRGLIICGVVTLVLIIALIVTAVILYFTILKPKQPKITTRAVTLDEIELVPFPFHLNITLGITINIDNRRNYGSFKYEDSKTNVSYRGDNVAEAPILADRIPARGTLDVSMSVVVIGEKMLTNPNFTSDFKFGTGVLNFTSFTTLHGLVRVWKIIKVKATSFSTCEISVNLSKNNATAFCSSKLKF